MGENGKIQHKAETAEGLKCGRKAEENQVGFPGNVQNMLQKERNQNLKNEVGIFPPFSTCEDFLNKLVYVLNSVEREITNARY